MGVWDKKDLQTTLPVRCTPSNKIVQNVAGQPIFRCSFRRGQSYLKKGYATKVD